MVRRALFADNVLVSACDSVRVCLYFERTGSFLLAVPKIK